MLKKCTTTAVCLFGFVCFAQVGDFLIAAHHTNETTRALIRAEIAAVDDNSASQR